MSAWSKFKGGLNWLGDNTPFVANAKGAIEGDWNKAAWGAFPGWVKSGKQAYGYIGSATGDTTSDDEKKNLEEMKAFKAQMLAALQERAANPLPAPQIGAPSWGGYQTPVGPGMQTGGTPVVQTQPQMSSPTPSAPNPAMAAEIERIKRQRMLQALSVPGHGRGIG